MAFRDILNSVMGLPQGSPGLKEAYGLIKDRKEQESWEDAGYGYDMGKKIKTRFGTTTDSGVLNEWAQRSLAERLGGLSLGSQYEQGQMAAPEVQGIATQYEQPIQGNTDPYSKYVALPQVQGRQRVEDIVPDEETIRKYVNNAKKYAGGVSADKRLTFRQPETVAENAEYVGQYIEAVMRLAPYFDLPPKTMASMLMEESGWGGQRFDGNLGGYGFLDSGEDMGIRFDAPTIEEQAAKYLEKVSSDWDGRYQGSRTPEDFHLKGYNPHKEYPGRVRSIMSMLEAN